VKAALKRTVDFPFYLQKHTDPEWGDEFQLWQVGCRFIADQSIHDGSTIGMGWFECDGIGQRTICEIKRIGMPGRMKDRVVFTKQYTKPNGEKGKKTVHIETVEKFDKINRGFVTNLTIFLKGVDICYDGKGSLS
jgi:hypothetical protein